MNLAAARARLAAVPDPEIPAVSLMELGIVRDLRETDAGLEVVLTPTYSGCPAMEQMADDIHAALLGAGLAARVVTQLAPAWSTEWMTPEGREKLRAYGIAPPPVGTGDSARGHNIVHFAPKNIATSARQTVVCPQCDSENTTEISHFGSTACKALYKCLDCFEPFDYFKPY